MLEVKSNSTRDFSMRIFCIYYAFLWGYDGGECVLPTFLSTRLERACAGWPAAILNFDQKAISSNGLIYQLKRLRTN